jgi:hypothetical protein
MFFHYHLQIMPDRFHQFLNLRHQYGLIPWLIATGAGRTVSDLPVNYSLFSFDCMNNWNSAGYFSTVSAKAAFLQIDFRDQALDLITLLGARVEK